MLGLSPALLPDTEGYASSKSISAWLYGFAGELNPEQAREKISRLESMRENPNRVLKKASQIISANAELFSLPADNPSPNDEEIFKLLLVEWDRHQQGGAMGTAFISERQTQALPFDHVQISHTADGEYQHYHSALRETYSLDNIENLVFRLIHLSDGISINAP